MAGTVTSGKLSTFECCGVQISPLALEEAVSRICDAAQEPQARVVHLCNAHSLALGTMDPTYREALRAGWMNLPDGVPVAWLGRRFGHRRLAAVRGASLMAGVLREGASTGLRHYLYGTSPETMSRLQHGLKIAIPEADIVGAYSPPFRDLTPTETSDIRNRILESQAQVVWVGLGTPKQDLFMQSMSTSLPLVMVGVGAAFDFLSGTITEAPPWIQGTGLEWLYRLCKEPKRLWRRYLFGNARFIRAVWRDFLYVSR